jgi:UDP-N-acetylmuramate dehydrogenase
MPLDEFLASVNIAAFFNEPMSRHTTFRTGGPADVCVPIGKAPVKDVAALLRHARSRAIPVQIIGGGANVVVADAGIRGITIDTRVSGTPPVRGGAVFTVPAGMSCDEAAELAAEKSLSGMEFMAALPGTIGGAIWMNARCWGKSVSDVLLGVEALDGDFNPVFEPFNASEWAYKKSPYQNKNTLILSADFRLAHGGAAEIRGRMAEYRLEREAKGHFRYPSAGSVFKNNPVFGKSSGKIIDELGLRGLRIGGACVADWHGNFIVNTGGASSSDIRALTLKIQSEARSRLGIELEPEILFIGDWQPDY